MAPLPLPRSGQRVKSNSPQDAQRSERFRSVERIEEHHCPIVVKSAGTSPTPILEQAAGVAQQGVRLALAQQVPAHRFAGPSLEQHLSGTTTTAALPLIVSRDSTCCTKLSCLLEVVDQKSADQSWPPISSTMSRRSVGEPGVAQDVAVRPELLDDAIRGVAHSSLSLFLDP